MEDEGLPPHQAQDQAKHMKEDHEITDVPHELGGGPGVPGVGKLLERSHIYHLMSIIPEMS